MERNENVVNNKKKKILLSSASKILACVLIMAVFATGTYAWFRANRIVKAKNLYTSLDVDDTTVFYEVYGFDEAANTGILLSTPEIADIVFNKYDMILLARNRYTPIFAKIVITRNETMPDSGTLDLNIYRDTAKPASDESDGTKLSKYSTSIMRFSGMVDAATGIDPEAENYPDLLYRYVDKKLYDTVQGLHENNDWSKVFTTATGSGSTYTISKTDTITLQLTYSSSDWYTVDGETRMNAFLYISYDNDLLQVYKATESMSGGSVTETIVPFENDLIVMKLTYEAAESQ